MLAHGHSLVTHADFLMWFERAFKLTSHSFIKIYCRASILAHCKSKKRRKKWGSILRNLDTGLPWHYKKSPFCAFIISENFLRKCNTNDEGKLRSSFKHPSTQGIKFIKMTVLVCRKYHLFSKINRTIVSKKHWKYSLNETLLKIVNTVKVVNVYYIYTYKYTWPMLWLRACIFKCLED